MNQYKFLKIYKDIANGRVHQDDLNVLYWDLKFSLEKNKDVGRFFTKSKPSPIEMAYAIDAVAHNIHQQGKEFLNNVFPDGDVNLFKSKLDELAGMENTSEVRKANRGYYTPLLATNGILFLEKQQVGMTTLDDIHDAIQEYERLVEAKIASPAEILTLERFSGNRSPYAKLVREMGLDKEKNGPLVVGGPASVVMIDKEGHLITAKALEKAFAKFMKNIRTRNMNIFHSDVQAGWVLPAYISKTGQVFKSGVNKHGLWIVAEVRDDTRVAQRMSEEILKGSIRSFSIAGSAIQTKYVQNGSMSFMRVDELELQEITFCEAGVNSGATFQILKSGEKIPEYDDDGERLIQIQKNYDDYFIMPKFVDATKIYGKKVQEQSKVSELQQYLNKL